MREERNHYRDLTFSAWRRCVKGTDNIDIDFMEYCGNKNCSRILALLETYEQVSPKNTSMMKRAANSIVQGSQKGVPAYAINYDTRCDSDGCWVVSAEIRQVAPIEADLGKFNEQELADWLATIHFNCECGKAPWSGWSPDFDCRWAPRTGVSKMVAKFDSVFIGIGGPIRRWLAEADNKFRDQVK